MKLLIVEDTPELQETLKEYLTDEGYLCETAGTYFEAEEKVGLHEYDVVILDIMLPDGSGLDVLRRLKEERMECGVLIISAKNSLEDKIDGLDLGADDYITKPFHLAELSARIKALLRRRNFGGLDEITMGRLHINHRNQQVTVGDATLELTKKEFKLLLHFVNNRNRVLTKQGIAEHLWGDDFDLIDNFDFIYTHVKNLRKKLQASQCGVTIKSVYGMGYKLEES